MRHLIGARMFDKIAETLESSPWNSERISTHGFAAWLDDVRSAVRASLEHRSDAAAIRMMLAAERAARQWRLDWTDGDVGLRIARASSLSEARGFALMAGSAARPWCDLLVSLKMADLGQLSDAAVNLRTLADSEWPAFEPIVDARSVRGWPTTHSAPMQWSLARLLSVSPHVVARITCRLTESSDPEVIPNRYTVWSFILNDAVARRRSPDTLIATIDATYTQILPGPSLSGYDELWAATMRVVELLADSADPNWLGRAMTMSFAMLRHYDFDRLSRSERRQKLRLFESHIARVLAATRSEKNRELLASTLHVIRTADLGPDDPSEPNDRDVRPPAADSTGVAAPDPWRPREDAKSPFERGLYALSATAQTSPSPAEDHPPAGSSSILDALHGALLDRWPRSASPVALETMRSFYGSRPDAWRARYELSWADVHRRLAHDRIAAGDAAQASTSLVEAARIARSSGELQGACDAVASLTSLDVLLASAVFDGFKLRSEAERQLWICTITTRLLREPRTAESKVWLRRLLPATDLIRSHEIELLCAGGGSKDDEIRAYLAPIAAQLSRDCIELARQATSDTPISEIADWLAAIGGFDGTVLSEGALAELTDAVLRLVRAEHPRQPGFVKLIALIEPLAGKNVTLRSPQIAALYVTLGELFGQLRGAYVSPSVLFALSIALDELFPARAESFAEQSFSLLAAEPDGGGTMDPRMRFAVRTMMHDAGGASLAELEVEKFSFALLQAPPPLARRYLPQIEALADRHSEGVRLRLLAAAGAAYALSGDAESAHRCLVAIPVPVLTRLGLLSRLGEAPSSAARDLRKTVIDILARSLDAGLDPSQLRTLFEQLLETSLDELPAARHEDYLQELGSLQ